MENNNENQQEEIEDNGKQTKRIIRFTISFVIMLFIFYEVYSIAMYTLGKKSSENMYIYNALNSFINKVSNNNDKQTTENYTLKFAALGDIYATNDTISLSKSLNTYDFTTGTENIQKILKNYDCVVASLNTPIATGTYSTKTKYNAPEELLTTLKSLNINILATANYHIYDMSESGITDTIKNIESNSMQQIGLNDSSTRNKPAIYEKNNIKIGVLSYTTSTNVDIATKKKYLVNKLSKDNIDEDIKYLNEQNVDYIISYLSISSDSALVSSEQKKDVEQLLESGVNIVLCTGSNIVKDKSEDEIELSTGSKNKTYAIYSLGDFIGQTDTTQHSTSIIADITFNKNVTKDKNRNVINDKTSKTYTVNTPIKLWTRLNSKATKIYNVEDAIKQYNEGTISLKASEYNDLLKESNRIDKLYK